MSALSLTGLPQMETLVLQRRPASPMTPEEFFVFCQANQEYRLEQTQEGEIVVKTLASTEHGRRNFMLTGALGVWAHEDDEGYGFDSSTGFKLPNGAICSPDCSWVRKERYDALTEKEKRKFAPICPDFVVELRSETDSLSELQEKMEEYRENGAMLGILIDPKNKTVHFYRPNKSVETVKKPSTITCDPEMPGLVFPGNLFWS
jgi:Uma2 family endonuclease